MTPDQHATLRRITKHFNQQSSEAQDNTSLSSHCDQALAISKQVGDGTGLEAEVEQGSNKNRELPSYYSSLAQSLYPHDHTPNQANQIIGLKKGADELQPDEDDFSLNEYLRIEQARVASKLQKLKGILSSCDENVRIMANSQVSEESNLTGHRNNTRIAKERLDMTQ